MSALQSSAVNLSALLANSQASANVQALSQNIGQGSGDGGKNQFSSLLDMVGNPENLSPVSPKSFQDSKNVKNEVKDPVAGAVEAPIVFRNHPHNNKQASDKSGDKATSGSGSDNRLATARADRKNDAANNQNVQNTDTQNSEKQVSEQAPVPIAAAAKPASAKGSDNANISDKQEEIAASTTADDAKTETNVDAVSSLLSVIAALLAGANVNNAVISATTDVANPAVGSDVNAVDTGQDVPVFSQLQKDLSQLQQLLQNANSANPPALSDAQNEQLSQINLALASDLDALKNMLSAQAPADLGQSQQDVQALLLAQVGQVSKATQAANSQLPSANIDNQQDLTPQLDDVKQLLQNDISLIKNALQKFAAGNMDSKVGNNLAGNNLAVNNVTVNTENLSENLPNNVPDNAQAQTDFVTPAISLPLVEDAKSGDSQVLDFTPETAVQASVTKQDLPLQITPTVIEQPILQKDVSLAKDILQTPQTDKPALSVENVKTEAVSAAVTADMVDAANFASTQIQDVKPAVNNAKDFTPEAVAVLVAAVTPQAIQPNAQLQNNHIQAAAVAQALAINSGNEAGNSGNFSQNSGGQNSGSQPQIMVGATAAPQSQQSINDGNKAGFSQLLNRTAQGQQANVADQVVFHVKTAIGSGNSKISIQLHPEDLGKLDIILDVGANGKTGVSITADNKQTLDLLQRDSRGLEKALADAGLKADSGSLSFNLRGGQQEERNQGQSQFQATGNYRKSQPDEEIIAPIATVTRSYGYTANMPDGLDIKI